MRSFGIIMTLALFWISGLVFPVYAESGAHGYMKTLPVETKKITMVMASPPESQEAKWLKMIYTEAFNRLGLTLVMKHYPPKRCSYLTDAEEVDGDIWRVYTYNETHPNLVRVEEPTYSAYFSAYSLDPKLRLEGWNSLVGTSLKVDYRRGVKMCESNLPRVVEPENLNPVNNVRIGLLKLIAGRTAVFVGVQSSVADALNSDEFRHSEIMKVGIMEEITTHAWLIGKHKHLALQVAGVLKQMKAEGLVEHYRIRSSE